MERIREWTDEWAERSVKNERLEKNIKVKRMEKVKKHPGMMVIIITAILRKSIHLYIFRLLNFLQ